MKNIKIIGIGVLSQAGITASEIWDTLESGNKPELVKGCIEYKSILPSAKRRRMNRYSDMAVYTSSKALEDAKVNVNEIDSYRIGTIFTTGYGPMVSNLQFGSSVVKGDPDLCSPTVFANTVSNACVGQVCMAFDCKGVSTIVMGSNNIGYSQMLLNRGKANFILSGAVEEYCEELYNSFQLNKYSKDVFIKEGTVTFLLKSSEVNDEAEDAYCQLVDFCECNIGKYPLVNKVDENSVKDRIVKTLSKFVSDSGKEIDFVISANNGSYFDSVENAVLEEVFDNKKLIIGNIKEYIGDTLGTSINMNVMVAAMILKNEKLPKAFANESVKQVKTILVTGYDVTGNYIGYILEK